MDTVAEDGEAITHDDGARIAKGLEFDVCICGGHGRIAVPSFGNSSQDSHRAWRKNAVLAYVAITRARKKLYLTNAFSRVQIFGQIRVANPPSRFIGEIPLRIAQGHRNGLCWTSLVLAGKSAVAVAALPALVSEAGGGRVFGQSSASGSRPRQQTRPAVKPEAQKKAAAKMTFTKGDTVDHKVFGRGTITKVDGDTLHVRFSRTGQTKKLLKDYAPIVKIG